MPPSQAAVLPFNGLATVSQDLTTDRGALQAALDALPRNSGTRIDFALEEAVAVFSNPARDPGSAPIIVLITDGKQSEGGSQPVINAAAGARRIGATLYTIGVGDDVDPTLLIRVAGDPDRFYEALMMPPEEKQRRMRRMRGVVRRNDIYWWLERFLRNMA